MKRILFAFLLLISTHSVYASSAATKLVKINLDLKYKENNQEIKNFTSSVSTKMGQEFSVLKDDLKMTFIATSSDQVGHEEEITLSGKIFVKEGEQEKMVAQPKMILLIGQEGTIVSEDELSGKYVEIKIGSEKI